MTTTTCPTCDGCGLVASTEEYNSGGPGWAKCPDCEWPMDPAYQAKLNRIKEIQQSLRDDSSQ